MSFLRGVAGSVYEALASSFAEADQKQRHEALALIVWEVARQLEQRSVGALDDGRPVVSSLGFVALGSESAFEEPFIEHQAVLAAGRVALHEYVHAAVEQALEQRSNAAQSQRDVNG